MLKERMKSEALEYVKMYPNSVPKDIMYTLQTFHKLTKEEAEEVYAKWSDSIKTKTP